MMLATGFLIAAICFGFLAKNYDIPAFSMANLLKREMASGSNFRFTNTIPTARSRQRNLDIVTRFLSSSNAAKPLRDAHVDLSQVKTALSALDDQALARLAARSEKAQSDFAAGRLSDRDLLIILIGIAALILIIVAVR